MPVAELGGLTCVTGDLTIQDSQLTDLSALSGLQGVGGYLGFQYNQSLVSLDGLENLTSVGYGLSITDNPVLSDLGGLSSLTSLGLLYPWGPGSMTVRNNPALPGCFWWQLEQQTNVECGASYLPCSGNTGQGTCGALPPGFVCDADAEGPGVYQGPLTIGGTGFPTPPVPGCRRADPRPGLRGPIGRVAGVPPSPVGASWHPPIIERSGDRASCGPAPTGSSNR